MMDSVYPEPLSRLHRRAVRKKFHKNNARYRTQPVTFAEIQEVDEESINDDTPIAVSTSKSDLDLKAKFEEFKRQRDKDLCECRLTTKEWEMGIENEILSDNSYYKKNLKENGIRDSQNTNSPTIVVTYRGNSSYPRTSV